MYAYCTPANMPKVYHKLWLVLLGLFALIFITFFVIFFKNSIWQTWSTNTESTLSAFGEILPNIHSEPSNPRKPIKVLILGDMMFDRGVRSKINARGFSEVFGEAPAVLSEYDLVMANLEGPITDNASKTVLENNKAIPGFQFTFPVGTANALRDNGIDIVSLANNHTFNFGQDGMDQTRKRLIDAGVQYFGSPENNFAIATSTCIGNNSSNKISDSTLSRHTTQNLCIGIVGWSEFGTKNYQLILDEIAKLRPTVDYLIVYPHWGVEYEYQPSELQKRLAREWLEAGADAVIGAHPHVPQRIEEYTTTDGRTVPIFYSLGNFIFDQYFSFETTHGIGVEISFDMNRAAASSISSSTAENAKLHPIYKLLPFSSVGSKVSIPDATSTARLYKIIKDASDANIGEWLIF